MQEPVGPLVEDNRGEVIEMHKPKKLEELTKHDFEQYECVRSYGAYNMFDPRAREMSGLSREAYSGVMKHYAVLVVKFPGVRQTSLG